MGSFNQTCAFSGLPITGGMKVRYFLLVENRPASGSSALHISDWYAPRTFPLTGVYADCGDLRNVQDGIQRDIWMRGLQLDVAEHGTGENTCHDKAVYKDRLSFDDLSDLIHEGVLYVEREPGYAEREARWKKRAEETEATLASLRMDGPPPSNSAEAQPAFVDKSPGIPYLQAVRHYIEAAGGAVVENWDAPGYVIGELGYADFSVRWAQISAMEAAVAELAKIRSALEEKYAVVLLNSSNCEPMLRLFPKLGTEKFYGFRGHTDMRKWEREAEEHVMVSKAFVREDVWQALLGLTLDSWRIGKQNIDSYVGFARKVYDAYVKHLAHRARATEKKKNGVEWSEEDYDVFYDFFYNFGGALLSDAEEKRELRDNPVMWLLSKHGEGHVRGVDLQDHFKLFVAANPPAEEVDAFLRVVAEMAFFRDLFGWTWRMWVPSRYSGQDQCEELHHEMLAAIAKVAGDWRKAEEDERASWEEDEDEDEAEEIGTEPGITSESPDFDARVLRAAAAIEDLRREGLITEAKADEFALFFHGLPRQRPEPEEQGPAS